MNRVRTAAWMVICGSVLASMWRAPDTRSREDWMVDEAIERGWDADLVVARHVVEVQRRLGVEGTEEELRASARGSGLLTTDPVVRARLVDRMRRSVEAGLVASDDILQAHLQAHPERFGTPAQVQVGLASGPDAPTARPELTWMTRARVASLHGAAVADALQVSGAWRGPVQTVRGRTWVWVEAERPGRLPALDEVREAVRQDWSRTPGLAESAVDRLRGGGCG